MDSATAVACNSFFSAESIYRSYGRTATVIYSGVDAAVFQSGPTVREHYVVSVGALDPIKGHATIVEALSLLPGEQRPALHIAFERHAPDYEMLLRNLANRLGVRIEFHPQLTDAELARLYASAQATICAARLEPFGLTPLESLSCGTPVVAINEGGFRESVTDGCNGALVAANSAGIAAGITAVLEHRISSDPDKLRATVASFTWERTVEELHRMFDVVSLSGTSTAKHGPV
jgi:glycosyltransferase involved in cell wall biosynthesis